MPPYLLLLNIWQNQFLLSLHSSFQKSLHSGGLQLPLPPLGLERYFCPPREVVFDWVISSDLPLNDPDIPTTLLHRSSPDISFAPSLALSCSCKVLQDLSSDHLPILLTLPLSLWCYSPTNVSLPSIFGKPVGMTLPSDLTLTVLLQRNTRLFPLLLLSLPIWH